MDWFDYLEEEGNIERREIRSAKAERFLPLTTNDKENDSDATNTDQPSERGQSGNDHEQQRGSTEAE